MPALRAMAAQRLTRSRLRFLNRPDVFSDPQELAANFSAATYFVTGFGGESLTPDGHLGFTMCRDRGCALDNLHRWDKRKFATGSFRKLGEVRWALGE
jgi:hypothetical protein